MLEPRRQRDVSLSRSDQPGALQDDVTDGASDATRVAAAPAATSF